MQLFRPCSCKSIRYQNQLLAMRYALRMLHLFIGYKPIPYFSAPGHSSGQTRSPLPGLGLASAAMGGGVTSSTTQYVKLYQLDGFPSIRLEALRRLACWICSLFKVRACCAVSRWSFSALSLVCYRAHSIPFSSHVVNVCFGSFSVNIAHCVRLSPDIACFLSISLFFGESMIKYEKMFALLYASGLNRYKLTQKNIINNTTYQSLYHNEAVYTKTIDHICGATIFMLYNQEP